MKDHLVLQTSVRTHLQRRGQVYYDCFRHAFRI